jgi:aminoglycoside phosphotransferase (APT) family kinase protein
VAEEIGDLTKRVAAATAEWAPGSTIGDLEKLKGGRSSLTFVTPVAGGPPDHARIVVKVAPAGLAPVRNRDVLRQARLLRALEDARGVRVPRVLFEEAGAPPEIPPFFAMSFAEGVCFEPTLDQADELPTPAEIDARARECARMMAALHAVRPDEVGLGDEPEVDLGEEVERWVRAFATVDDDMRPGADDCAESLRRSMPAAVASTLVHGDFRVGNTLCEGKEVNAIVDWEIWARSDPRVDVAWFLLSSNAAGHPSAIREAIGMPGDDELLAEYLTAGGVPVDDLDWFKAHALFKIASVTALLVKNARKRGEAEAFSPAHIPDMIARARAMLGRA